jgi:hypothetical protein
MYDHSEVRSSYDSNGMVWSRLDPVYLINWLNVTLTSQRYQQISLFNDKATIHKTVQAI